ncbi:MULTISPECIES: CheW domain-containing protein [unclassified Pseudomonas]|uniref:CheW domain-containing protein n=1 Tax=unclassified Pseudomonas TaxID=196821 RepID=UPI002AC8F104|nr:MULTISPECIES: CheW domain-containing protein [unclassified Pseudomonas]MEB0043027.1 chemotaxis protein CheW [Pseudomonas sp. MH10]MEB0080031.1 chemotaxis protein CheW [Pseudomonas sp. MH10out]MEB0094016.1 chemotaxis protein CheW [Pseudomonas sp. CCI4.2]MEB0103324.1 chemotaxis protein CheW [Pseudomonas sp. CCI3.2]MEB0121024.1 chemotaxis protein CheW [Pseudomonas sp. CCI1.2]
MNRPVDIATRPQLALQSYLDALLFDATQELTVSSDLDEFQAAVLEEQARDAVVSAALAAVVVAVPVPSVVHELALPAPVALVPKVIEAKPVVERSVTMFSSVVDVPVALAQGTPPPLAKDGRPAWAAEPFECLLFDVAGLTLAVPLVCLGSIYSLAGTELTPLFGQPDWFLGILPSQSGNLKVLDTARWVMPDRYRDDFRQGLQYVISVQGYEWGLAVHHVSRSIRLDPNEIKWRSQRGQRPWLAGTVIEHMCALLDVSELAELIASGAVKQMGVIK